MIETMIDGKYYKVKKNHEILQIGTVVETNSIYGRKPFSLAKIIEYSGNDTNELCYIIKIIEITNYERGGRGSTGFYSLNSTHDFHHTYIQLVEDKRI